MTSPCNLGLPMLSFLFLLCLSLSPFVKSVQVTCGSTLKLQHFATKFRLHSHDISYGRGSQQQSVTTYPSGDDGNSLWSLHRTKEEPCFSGDLITKGTLVRLQHVNTRKWLHSHKHKSPLTSKQEVSAYGSDADSDGGDLWVVDWDGKQASWEQDTRVRLKHRDTGAYLYSSEARFGSPISGQHEACAHDKRDRNSEWVAAEGVYMPPWKPEGGDEAAAAAAGGEAAGDKNEL